MLGLSREPRATKFGPSLDARLEALYSKFERSELQAVDRELRSIDDAAGSAFVVQMWKAVGLHILNGMAGEALPLATKAIRCARRSADSSSLRRLLNTRGEVHRLSGDLAHALEDYIESYEVALSLTAAERAATLQNVASVPQELGLVEIAERVLLYALQFLERCEKSDTIVTLTRAMILANIGGTLLWTDPSRSAEVSLDALCKAQELGASTGLLRLHRHDLIVRARINVLIAYLQIGDEQRSLAVARQLRADEATANDELALCVRTVLAATQARFDDRAVGMVKLRDAVALERRSLGDWIEGVKLLVQALEFEGKEREAIDCLRVMHMRIQAVRRGIAVEELRRIDLDLPFDVAERSFERTLAHFAVATDRLSVRLSAKLGHLERVAITAELREGIEANRAGHIYRVGRLSAELAAEVGCNAELQWLAEVAGRLHDIGKVAVPDDALNGTARHTSLMEIVRQHAEYGARLVADADEPRLVQVVAAVRHHHERVDGSGYPTALSGDEIPLLARIVAIAESFDAMLQSRAYRSSRNVRSALEEIERCAGTQFDARLAGVFVGLVRRLVREQGDIQEYLGKQASAVSSVRAFERLELLGLSPGR
jgi:putative nucleotidyltransferase with HDIG domain